MKTFLRFFLSCSIIFLCFSNKTIAQCWKQNDLFSFGQVDWADSRNIATITLENNFYNVYTSGTLEVGIPGDAGYSLRFAGGNFIVDYLQASGTPAALNADLADPSTTSSGSFGGEVLALQLNVDFSDAGITTSNSSTKFGDLTLQNLTTLSSLNGMSVRQILSLANNLLGGGTGSVSISDLNQLLHDLNGSFESDKTYAFFEESNPDAFAQTYLNGWSGSDIVTYTQAEWGGDAGGATSLLYDDFYVVYTSTSGVVEIGIPGNAGYSIRFGSLSSILTYIPAIGPGAALNADLVDPSTTSSGVFGGEVLALKLNVDYSDAGILVGPSNTNFGDLVLYNINSLPALNGMSVRQVLDLANTLLGGGSGVVSIADLDPVLAEINTSFDFGIPSTFAQQHLRIGWKDGDVITYPQNGWDVGGAGADILSAHYGTVYASNFGVVEIGLPGATGYSAQFAGFAFIQDFFPALGLSTSLNTDLLNPTSTSAGEFGGDVLALKLNIDFSDAGFLTGASDIRFGDLILYNLTSVPSLNGLRVRDVFDIANTLLGGGSNGFTINDIAPITALLCESFGGGGVSSFAQQHLFPETCAGATTNHCPTANNLTVSTPVGNSINFQLQGSDEDNDPLTYSISQNPSHGTVTISNDSTIYTPDAGYYGADQFSYKASDGQCESGEATVDISVVVCPQGQGSWKNNSNWPVASLMLGTISYTQTQLINILNMPVGTGKKADASLILAKQLIATKLNIANGTEAPDPVPDSITVADALIGNNIIPMKVRPNTATGSKMTTLASFLEGFDDGTLTQGCRQTITMAVSNGYSNIAPLASPAFMLGQNQPNPAMNSTAISYQLPQASVTYHVSLKVYDALGREVATLVDRVQTAGHQVVQFNTSTLPGGIYYYRLTTGSLSETKKMIVIK